MTTRTNDRASLLPRWVETVGDVTFGLIVGWIIFDQGEVLVGMVMLAAMLVAVVLRHWRRRP